MMRHAKEPWVDEYGMVLDDKKNSICTCGPEDAGPTEVDDANAARIVACVNALAGIPTDEIDKTVKAWRYIAATSDPEAWVKYVKGTMARMKGVK